MINIRPFILILLLALSLSAQQPTGYVEGTVFNDVTKEPIAGASIRVVGSMMGAASDSEGKFVIRGISVGTYQIRVSAIGFEPHIHTDVIVAAGKQTQVSIGLQEALLEIKGVTITTEYFQKSPDDPVSIQTLGAEEIRRLPGGFEDVLRAVSILPGVAQVQTGRNDLIVRSGAPSENLYVVDNIELSNINHFGTQGASGGPLSFINLDFINEASFRTGGFGVKYGDKLSSVLTIDLKDGRTDRFGGKATISSSQFGLNLEGPMDTNGSFIFSARRSYLDFIFKAAGFGFVPEYWDFLGKVNYKFSQQDNLNIIGIAALDNNKLFNDTPEKRYDNSQLLDNDQNQFIGGMTWRHLLPNGFSNVTLSQTYNGYNFEQSDTTLHPVFRSNSKQYETTLRADLVYQWNKETEVTFGGEEKYIRFNSDILLPSFWTNFGQNISINASLDTTAFKSAGYVQLSHLLLQNLRIIVGERIDYFNLIKSPAAFSPRFSLSYALSAMMTINGSIGKYKQAPSYIWLVANPINRNLSFITVHQYVFGIEYLLRSDIKLSVEVYQKYYSNYPASTTRPYLVLANTGAGFGGSEDGYASFGLDPLVSAGSGIAQGVEVFAQKKLSDIPLYGLVSISYNQSTFKALDGVERPSSFDQRWIINLGGGYIMNEQWEFGGKFRFVTGRPYTPYNADGSQNISMFNNKRIDINHSLDLRIDRRWNFDRWNLITYVDVQNVYNKKPVDVPRYDAHTKMIKENDAIGILPSIGISAEW